MFKNNPTIEYEPFDDFIGWSIADAKSLLLSNGWVEDDYNSYNRQYQIFWENTKPRVTSLNLEIENDKVIDSFIENE